MSTIANKLQRILDTKEDIRQALIEEGKDVPADMPFRLYPEVVRNSKLGGLIGMYTGKGYTNESMSKNPVWYDTSGNGNHIALKNFGWKLDSGCGKYAYDFSKSPFVVVERLAICTRKSVIFNAVDNAVSFNMLIKNNSRTFKCRIKITGLSDAILRKEVEVFTIYDAGNNSKEQRIIGDGIYEIEYIASEGIDRIYFYLRPAVGYKVLKEPVIVEQIPDYAGAICFDGVDDFGICETFPVLTKEKGYTVMALRSWITRDKNFEGLISGVKRWNANGAFLLEYKNNASSLAVSFGKATVINIPSSILTYQTTTEYNGTRLLVGEYAGEDVLLVGRSAIEGFQFYSNFALYAFAIFDHDTTAEERQPVIDYWKKEFPELFPDEAWTVTGKSNEDADRATVKNLTDNGNDLVLSNFAFAENSGYGLYAQDLVGINSNNGKYWIVTERFHHKTKFVCVQPNNMPVFWRGYNADKPWILKFSSNREDVQFQLRFLDNNSVILKNIDLTIGVNHIPALKDEVLSSTSPGILIKGSIAVDDWFEVEEIPDYEGYLVTDGVDDQVTSSGFTLSEKYTIVGDWELMTNTPSNSGICKSGQFYVYNTESGIVLYLNSTNKGNPMPIKQLKAICSDGRCYDKNWNEIIASPGDISGSSSAISIGYFSDRFTQVAFKNLAIYKDKVFTKEQCIQAYNHLQTLKAK